MDDKERLWRSVLGEIEVGMSPANFQTWFKNTSLDDIQEDKGVVIIRVPNDFTKGWLQQKYQKEIHRCLNKHLGRVVAVQYVVGTKSWPRWPAAHLRPNYPPRLNPSPRRQLSCRPKG